MSYPLRMPDRLRLGYKNLSPAKVVNGWPFSVLIVTPHLLDGRTLLAIVALYHGLEKVRLAPLGTARASPSLNPIQRKVPMPFSLA